MSFQVAVSGSSFNPFPMMITSIKQGLRSCCSSRLHLDHPERSFVHGQNTSTCLKITTFGKHISHTKSERLVYSCYNLTMSTFVWKKKLPKPEIWNNSRKCQRHSAGQVASMERKNENKYFIWETLHQNLSLTKSLWLRHNFCICFHKDCLACWLSPVFSRSIMKNMTVTILFFRHTPASASVWSHAFHT